MSTPRLDSRPTGGTLATVAALHAAACTLRIGELELATEDQRADMLARVGRGEQVELYLDFVAFSQAPGVTNRNFVRFAPDSLPALAATGTGTPFLRDHDQGSMSAVGGTIVASRLEQNGAAVELRQTARLVEPWAQRHALLGTMRGFSIGWNPIAAPGKLEPELNCTVCKAPVRNCLFELGHWRGKAVAGQVVEWEFQAAELIETSAVPVPAVREVRPLEVREQSIAALAAELSSFGITVPVPDAVPNQENKVDLTKIATALGVKTEANEDAILGAIRERDGEIVKLKAEVDSANGRAKEAQANADRMSGELATEKARAWADGLVAAGKLQPEGKLYAHLVEQHKLNAQAAEELAASLPVITPVKRELQSDRTADKADVLKADGTPNYEALAGKLSAEDQADARAFVKAMKGKATVSDYVAQNYAALAETYGWPRSN